MANPDWITVYSAFNLSEAQIVQGRLQHDGIPAIIHYPVGGVAMGIYLGEISVLVRPEYYEVAMASLNPDEPYELPDLTEDITYSWDDDDNDQ